MAYSLIASWPPNQLPNYLKLGDGLKIEAEKFDRSTPSGAAAAEVQHSLAQFERWKSNPRELEQLLWRQWVLDLGLILVGVVGAALLLARRRQWIALGFVAAVWYLSEHHLAPIYGIFLRGTTSAADVLGRVEVVAKSPGLLASVLHYDLVVPLLCLWVLMAACLSLMPSREVHSKSCVI